jgi:phage gpG-like protein
MATNVTMKWRGKKYSQNVHRAMVKAIERSSLKVHQTAQELLSVSGSFPGEPSPPGEPPHKQTGHLRMSMGYEIAGDKLSAKVGPRDLMKYGRVHEFGDKEQGLPARPFLGPAFQKCLPVMQKWISEALKKAGTS